MCLVTTGDWGDLPAAQSWRALWEDNLRSRLWARLLNEGRFELMVLLMKSLDISWISPDWKAALNKLMPLAITKYQYCSMREASLLMGLEPRLYEDFDKELWDTQLRECGEFYQQAGYCALAERVEERMVTLQHMPLRLSATLIHMSHASDLSRSIHKVIKGVENLSWKTDISNGDSADQMYRALCDAYDADASRHATKPAIEGRPSLFFILLLDLMNLLDRDRERNRAPLIFFATVAYSAWRKAIKDNRRPSLCTGIALLNRTLSVLEMEFGTQKQQGLLPSLEFAELLRDLAYDRWKLILKDTEQINITATEAAMAPCDYFKWAIHSARWLTGNARADTLNEIKKLARESLSLDLKQNLPLPAVIKCNLVQELYLYHPNKTHILDVSKIELHGKAEALLRGNDWTSPEDLLVAECGFEAVQTLWGVWAHVERKNGLIVSREAGGEPSHFDFLDIDFFPADLPAGRLCDPGFIEECKELRRVRALQDITTNGPWRGATKWCMIKSEWAFE